MRSSGPIGYRMKVFMKAVDGTARMTTQKILITTPFGVLFRIFEENF